MTAEVAEEAFGFIVQVRAVRWAGRKVKATRRAVAECSAQDAARLLALSGDMGMTEECLRLDGIEQGVKAARSMGVMLLATAELSNVAAERGGVEFARYGEEGREGAWSVSVAEGPDADAVFEALDRLGRLLGALGCEGGLEQVARSDDECVGFGWELKGSGSDDADSGEMMATLPQGSESGRSLVERLRLMKAVPEPGRERRRRPGL